jgi:hypothetical protein
MLHQTLGLVLAAQSARFYDVVRPCLRENAYSAQVCAARLREDEEDDKADRARRRALKRRRVENANAARCGHRCIRF